MKARTRKYEPKCEIYFCYEDYDGKVFRSYDELIEKGVAPFVLCGYLYSFWFNRSELIDELDISKTRRPTRSEVANFIARCKEEIFNY